MAETLTLEGNTLNLQLPAGPFVSVTVVGAVLTVGSIPLTGDFSFEQVTQQPGNVKKILFAAANVSLTYSGNGITNGQGAFVILPATTSPASAGGVAGMLSGNVALAAGGGGFSAGGSFGLRINTATTAVDESVNLNGQTIAIQFAANEIPPFERLGDDLVTR